MATGQWRLRPGKFSAPAWVSSAQALPDETRLRLETLTSPVGRFERDLGQKGPWSRAELEDQFKRRMRPKLADIVGTVAAPCSWDPDMHWFKDVQSWSLPQLLVSMGERRSCRDLWDYWCSLPVLVPPRRRGARVEGSKRATSNALRANQYVEAKNKAKSLIAELGIEGPLTKADWRAVLKRLGAFLGASVFITHTPVAVMELPVMQGHDSKAAMWERVTCDERITFPRELLARLPSLAKEFNNMKGLVEVKIYYRCNTPICWVQKVDDANMIQVLDNKLGATAITPGTEQVTGGSVAVGAESTITRDVHMSAAPVEMVDPKAGDLQAKDPLQAQEQGALPPPSVHTVLCTCSKDYLKKNKLDKTARWYWFSAVCGLVMSAVSSWEIRTKQWGEHNKGGYCCRHCRGMWKAGRPGSRMLDICDGQSRVQLILNEPDEALWNRWARDRMELCKRLEPNEAPRDEAPPSDVPSSHRIQLSALVSDAVWQVVLGNHEAAGLRHIQDIAQQSVQ